MKKIAVIGYGALGQILVDVLLDQLHDTYSLQGIFDCACKEAYIEAKGEKIQAYANFESLLADDLDMVIEIAGVGAVKDYTLPILESGRDLVITSMGAFADPDLYESIQESAEKYGRKVHLTSGAIGGFDILQTISMMGGAKTKVRSTKQPKSLNGAPYLQGRDLPEGKRLEVFSGNAREAIVGFPKNTNVSVAAGLASIGLDETEVQIFSDPESQGNVHEISIENAKARAKIIIGAKPDENNPKSSVTAAWSVAALLRNLANPIQLF